MRESKSRRHGAVTRKAIGALLAGLAVVALGGCGPELLLLLAAMEGGGSAGGGDVGGGGVGGELPRERPRQIEGVEGCGGPQGGDGSGVITRAVEYDVHLSGDYASATMEVHLCSGSETVEEATLRFALPRGAVIHGAEILLPEQGRWERAETVGRLQGEMAYDAVVHPPEDPGPWDDPLLVQQIGLDLYRARVFPVDAWLGGRIRIHYAHLLERTDEGLEMEVALDDPDALPLDPSRGLHVTVSADPGAFADGSWDLPEGVGASSFDGSAGTGWVEVAHDAPLDQDLRLSLQRHEPSAEAGMLRYRSEQDELYEWVHLYWRPLALEEDQRLTPRPRNVVFVLDVSGSMSGRKLAETQRAVIHMLEELGEADRFGLVAFDDVTYAFSAEMRSGQEVEDAIRWVEALTAGGSTGLAAALVRGAQIGLGNAIDDDPSLELFIVTDGLPNVGAQSPEEILAELGATTDRWGGTVRLDACGIGFDLSQGFLNDLVQPTGGEATFALADGEITGQILDLFGRVRQGGLSDLSLIVDGNEDQTYHHRRVLPGATLSAGHVCEVGDHLELSLEGFAPDLTLVRAAVEVEAAEAGSDGVHLLAPALAAKAWADRLERQIDEEGESPQLVDEAVVLARTYGIVTRYSSMLALEFPEMYDEAAIERPGRDPAGIALGPVDGAVVDERRIGGEGTVDAVSMIAPEGCSCTAAGASRPVSLGWITLALLALGAVARMRRG